MADGPAHGEMPRAYEPGAVESRIYEGWVEKGYFTPEIDRSKTPFTVIMPPPNVTGELHMGHALTIALEDLMVRWHRMLGEPTLYLPGTDHAGIATQVGCRASACVRWHDAPRPGTRGVRRTSLVVGRLNTATAYTGRSSGSAPPATGAAARSHWTQALPAPSGLRSSTCTARD